MEDIRKISRIVRECREKCLVDMIVLSHNGNSVSRDFLKFFAKNTPKKKVHLLWVDNNSTDDTIDILSRFSQEYRYMSVMVNSENLGVIGGRNVGYFFAQKRDKRGKYVMFLDNDQFVQPNWINQHVDFLESGYDVIGVEAWQMNNHFLPIKKINHIKEFFTYVGCGGMLMEYNVPENIGIFDMRFNPSYFEDPDFIFKCHNADYRIGWNYKAKMVHLPHQTLGKLDQKEKAERFGKSLRLFREKWKGYKPPRFYQKPI